MILRRLRRLLTGRVVKAYCKPCQTQKRKQDKVKDHEEWSIHQFPITNVSISYYIDKNMETLITGTSLISVTTNNNVIRNNYDNIDKKLYNKTKTAIFIECINKYVNKYITKNAQDNSMIYYILNNTDYIKLLYILLDTINDVIDVKMALNIEEHSVTIMFSMDFSENKLVHFSDMFHQIGYQTLCSHISNTTKMSIFNPKSGETSVHFTITYVGVADLSEPLSAYKDYSAIDDIISRKSQTIL